MSQVKEECLLGLPPWTIGQTRQFKEECKERKRENRRKGRGKNEEKGKRGRGEEGIVE